MQEENGLTGCLQPPKSSSASSPPWSKGWKCLGGPRAGLQVVQDKVP